MLNDWPGGYLMVGEFWTFNNCHKFLVINTNDERPR